MIVPVKNKNLIFLFKKPSAARGDKELCIVTFLNIRLKHANFND